ncbi:Latrophilin Cirl [Gryllus bimaculatus]|nr:Latrophilin Cirl [Gryllus bimaculatus]
MLVLLFSLIELSCVKGSTKIINTGCEVDIQFNLQPQLQWRQNSAPVLFFEIYYPFGMCNFSSLKQNQRVKNPSCIFKDAPLDQNENLEVQFVNISVWESQFAYVNLTANIIHYNIQKALFRVPEELEGTVHCRLQSRDDKSNAITRLISEREGSKTTAYVTVHYNSSVCLSPNCSRDDWKKASNNLTTILKNEIKLRIEVRAMEEEEEEEEALVRRLRLVRAGPALRVVGVRGARACAADGPWPRTPAGGVAALRVPPAPGDVRARRCLADARRGARWEAAARADAPEQHALQQGEITSLLSQRLEELSKQTTKNGTRIGSEELLELESILINDTNIKLSEYDIWNIAHVLGSIEHAEELNSQCISTITNVVNELLVLNTEGQRDNLRSMQKKAATSNVLLKSLDRILQMAPLPLSKELVVRKKITTFVLNTVGNYTSIPRGIGVLPHDGEHFENQTVIQIPYNASLQWVLNKGFSAAVFLPESLLRKLRTSSHRLVMSIFWNSELFGGTTIQEASGHVVSIAIDGKHAELEDPILLFFAKQDRELVNGQNKTDKNVCRFWNFEANDGSGKWDAAGCFLAEYPDNATDICICTHLTHFGKLLYNVGNNPSKLEEEGLEIVTMIGCSLSLLGLMGVFLSAILFPGEGSGRWLQLQLCAAQAILMAAILWDGAAASHAESVPLCLVRGLLLHWSALALGIWTLVAAFYQHRRLTKPLHALHTDSRFLPMASAMSWGCPVVMCVVVLIVDSHAYEPHSCYPSGVTLLLAVVIPLGIIVVTNSVLFLLVIWSICQCNPHPVTLRDSQEDSTRIVRRVLASSYLFCLLGLCWLFGFLHWQYLFCITASMQGVSHFVFCVILDRATRRSWRLYKKKKQLHFSSLKSWTRSSLLPSSKSKLSSALELEGTKI